MDGVDDQVSVSPFDEGLEQALNQVAELVDSGVLALDGTEARLAYGIYLLREAEMRISSLGCDHDLPNSTATALLAARDALSAHLLAGAMLAEGGARPWVGRGLVRRGAVDCQAILEQIRKCHVCDLVLDS